MKPVIGLSGSRSAERGYFGESQVGSLEPRKLADFIVIDTDVLACPPEKIAQTKVLRTYLGGRQVFERKAAADGARGQGL